MVDIASECVHWTVGAMMMIHGWHSVWVCSLNNRCHDDDSWLHHGTYCSMNTLRRYVNHESSSWHLLFNEHTQTLCQPWIIIMAPTVHWTHSDAMSTMNHHHGTYCSMNTLRRYVNCVHWTVGTMMMIHGWHSVWVCSLNSRYHDDDSWLT
jgi:hypothetical protein